VTRKSGNGEGDALAKAYAGVRKLDTRKRRARAGGADSAPAPRIEAAAVPFRLDRDEDGRVTALRENISDRVLRELRGRRFEPQATLDLHGMHAEEAGRAVAAFVRDARNRGLRQVLIIHGKGLHSEGGPGVLGDRVVTALTGSESSRAVLAFATADERHGGRGAVAVRVAGR
jgi:DNA-nicking Smr family endonuclease